MNEKKTAWKAFNRDDVEKFPHKILLSITELLE